MCLAGEEGGSGEISGQTNVSAKTDNRKNMLFFDKKTNGY